MIENRFKMLLIGATLVGSSLFADTSSYNSGTHSLLGIEGGYNSLGYKYKTVTSSVSAFNAGLKLGAETEDYRLFLSARYFHTSSSEYDSITTYGGELDRKFSITKLLNLFVGIDGGIANLSYNASGENFTRTISNPYFGGEAGTNIHFGNSIDWEMGARMITIQADNIKEGRTYHVNNMLSIYTSIIFKWHMD